MLDGGSGISMTTRDGPIHISSVQSSSTIGAVNASTGGLNDLALTGYYTGTADGTLYVQIAAVTGSADTFTWRFVPRGVSPASVALSPPAAITAGHAVYLSDGVSAVFNHNTGHTGTEQWFAVITAGVSAPTTIVGSTVNATALAGDLNISAANQAIITAGVVSIEGEQSVDLQTGGAMTLSAATHLEIGATAANVSVTAASDLNFASTAGNVNISAAAGTVDISGGSVRLSSTSTDVDVNAAQNLNLHSVAQASLTGATVQINSTTGNVELNAGSSVSIASDGTASFSGRMGTTVASPQGKLSMEAGTGIEMTTAGNVTVDATGNVAFTAGGDMQLLTTGVCKDGNTVTASFQTGITAALSDGRLTPAEVNILMAACTAGNYTWVDAGKISATSQNGIELQSSGGGIQLTASDPSSGTVSINASAAVDISGDTVGLTAAQNLTVESTSGQLTVEGQGGVALQATNGDVNILTDSTVSIDGIGGVSVTSWHR